MCRQHFIFKNLQFGRDKTLDIFQRLAALVIGGCLFRLNLRQLDIKTVYAVELHLQSGQTRAFPFARFQSQQKFIAVILNMAQLVQLG